MGAASSPYQLGGGVTSGKWDINGVIDALAADQLITILAEPNLTAQSGETASFLAGGEFPSRSPELVQRRDHGHGRIQAIRREPRVGTNCADTQPAQSASQA